MINEANTVFLIMSSILVFCMTPGLAFFYGGLVSRKNVVNTMLSVFIICGVAVLLFCFVGYELCFNGDSFGIIGHVKHLFLSGLDLGQIVNQDAKINLGTYLIFEMMFAIITPALFVGAIVGRMRFNFLLAFIILWTLLIYYPLVHIVWSSQGFLFKAGVLDFAGGTVVHINAGITALVLSIFLGPRLKKQTNHYDLPWVLLGTAILWIGWYGFNAGSALTVNTIALQAFITTTIATGSAMMMWMLLEMKVNQKPSLVGVCTGALCGLVGITPGAGYVTVVGAFFIGILCTCISFSFITYIKPKLKYDDPLDAFGCHGVSGIAGSILTGAFASKSVNKAIDNGLFYGGGWNQVVLQLAGTIFTIIFTTILVIILIVILRKFILMRVPEAEEIKGLDAGEHGEEVDSMAGTHEVERYRNEFQGQLAHLLGQNGPRYR